MLRSIQQESGIRKPRKTQHGGNNNNANVDAFFASLDDLRGLIRFFEYNPDFNVNVKKDGINALFYILMNELDYESEDIIQVLINKGLDVNTTNEKGETALFILALHQNFESMRSILTLLLNSGLDINHTTNDGLNVYNALHSKHKEIYSDTFKLLFELGLNFMYEHNNDTAMRGFLQKHFIDNNYKEEVFNTFPTVATETIEGNSYFHTFLMDKKDLDDFSEDENDPYKEYDKEVKEKLERGELNDYGLEELDNPIHIHFVLKQFINHGFNVNSPYKDGNTALHSFINFANRRDFDYEIEYGDSFGYLYDGYYLIIKTFLENGADPYLKNADGKSAIDLNESGHIDYWLKQKIPEKWKGWKGWTRADIAHMDDIFHEAIATNTNLTRVNEEESLFSMCPVCLKYIQHETGTCMYMTHDCKESGGFYHNSLYEKYKYKKLDVLGRPTNKEVICWCTLCGRICRNHQHYLIASWDSPLPSLQPPGAPYETDCRVTNGGGGKPEKLGRYRRLREFVAEDMNELVGTISKQSAYERMVEEMWNAPLVSRASRIRHIETSKEWNIPASAFPIPQSRALANAPNIPYTGQLPLIHPIETNDFKNSMNVDETNIIQFRHGTNQHAGPGQQISRNALIGFLKDVMGDPNGERFGKCWQYSTAAQQAVMSSEQKALVCSEPLHPEEVRAALDLTDPKQAELYEGYRKQFNRRHQN